MFSTPLWLRKIWILARKRNVSAFLVSWLFAFVLWLLISMNAEHQMIVRVKIKVVQLPEDIKLDYAPNELKLVVSGKGRSLFQLQRKLRRNSLEVPYSLLRSGDWRIESGQLSSLLDFSNQIKLIQFLPEQVSVKAQQLFKKELPLSLNKTISFQAGYQEVASPRLTPPRVWVYASSPIGPEITSIETENLHFNQLGGGISSEVRLINPDPQRYKLSQTTARLQLFVERIIEKSITVPINTTRLPQDVILVPAEVLLTYKAKEQDFHGIDVDDFEVTVELPTSPSQRMMNTIIKFNSTKVLEVTVAPQRIDYIRP